MNLNTVIFDMDGLLIDSEPFWQEAGVEILQQYNVVLTLEQYHQSTGLGTRDWVKYWFNFFNIQPRHEEEARISIIDTAIRKIRENAKPMPGSYEILEFFKKKEFRIGLATSSPSDLIDVVVDKLGIRGYFDAFSSAETLEYSKPHPQVYLHCAGLLKSSPLECVCFEDSFNGMIAVKAARMKCVVIPAPDLFHFTRWDAGDLKLQSLLAFNEESLLHLGK
jgi:mannitol-1-/sugar-/sorbitol-6-/2-deoxyglucose-6-phosphatase